MPDYGSRLVNTLSLARLSPLFGFSCRVWVHLIYVQMFLTKNSRQQKKLVEFVCLFVCLFICVLLLVVVVVERFAHGFSFFFEFSWFCCRCWSRSCVRVLCSMFRFRNEMKAWARRRSLKVKVDIHSIIQTPQNNKQQTGKQSVSQSN